MTTPEDLIGAARRVLVICHVSPDGDAIGSLLGMGHILDALGKDVTVACADPVPVEFHFLPGAANLTQHPVGRFDLVIGLDSSDPSRLGSAYDAQAMRHAPLLNVDHHATNLNFGTVNWVDEGYASTCQMVLELGDRLDVAVNLEIATCLLCGIVTDTRGFQTPNTDLAALQAAVRLASAGANLHEIADRTLVQRPFAMVRLWGRVLSNVRLQNGVVWASLPFETVEETHPTTNGLRGLVSFLSGTEEARIAVLFTEKEKGRVEVSMRSGPGIDVAQAALAMGGGGHPRAAGMTLPGSLEEVQQIVLERLRDLVRAESPQPTDG